MRRGCHIHVASATWLGHPRRMNGARAGSTSHGSVPGSAGTPGAARRGARRWLAVTAAHEEYHGDADEDDRGGGADRQGIDLAGALADLAGALAGALADLAG